MYNQETPVRYHNTVTLVGHLKSDPILKDTKGGPLVKTTLVTKQYIKNCYGKEYVQAYHHTIVFDEDMAIAFSGQTKQGDMIQVEGYLRYWKPKDSQEVKCEIKCHYFHQTGLTVDL